MKARLVPVLVLLLCWASQGTLAAEDRVDEGTLKQAKYRIIMPEKWNGGLVLICHGYSADPLLLSVASTAPFRTRGYAVAMSSYSTGGWAVKEAVEDTEALRQEFIRKYGQPKETWITGFSMGGHITLAIIEQNGREYDGALPLCGANQPEYEFLSSIFAGRAVFDYYYPGLLPPPDKVPEGFRATREFTAELLKKMQAAPSAGLPALLRMTGFASERELAGATALGTEVLGTVEKMAGGNPFDNRAVLYDDAALQKGVRRYAPEEKAEQWLTSRYDLSGRLQRPVLALQKTNDGLVTSAATNAYGPLARSAGSGSWFVQRYVEGTGHCNFTGEQIGAAFDALRNWKRSGKRPDPGLVPVP